MSDTTSAKRDLKNLVDGIGNEHRVNRTMNSNYRSQISDMILLIQRQDDELESRIDGFMRDGNSEDPQIIMEKLRANADTLADLVVTKNTYNIGKNIIDGICR